VLSLPAACNGPDFPNFSQRVTDSRADECEGGSEDRLVWAPSGRRDLPPATTAARARKKPPSTPAPTGPSGRRCRSNLERSMSAQEPDRRRPSPPPRLPQRLATGRRRRSHREKSIRLPARSVRPEDPRDRPEASGRLGGPQVCLPPPAASRSTLPGVAALNAQFRDAPRPGAWRSLLPDHCRAVGTAATYYQPNGDVQLHGQNPPRDRLAVPLHDVTKRRER